MNSRIGSTEEPFGDLLAYPLRSGVTVPRELRGKGIKMVNMGELFAHPIIPSVEMARVDIDVDDAARFLLAEGDLLFARRSLTLEGAGKCSILGQIYEPTTWESSIIRARLNPAVAASKFYFYYFQSPQGRASIERIVEQVAAAGIRISDLARITVPVPLLRDQHAIAEVLGALDDKIAANRRLVETSDELVRAWFDMCKGALQTKPVSELVSNVRSTVAPKNMHRNRTYLGLEHLPRRNLWVAEYGNTSEVQSAKSEFCDGDILFGKLRPYFHKVCTAPSAGLCSTDILVLRPQSPDIAGYALAALASDEVIEKVTAASEGTRMPRTSWKDLGAITVPWPGNDEARRISQRIDGVRSAALCAVRESRMLAAIRDALLPRLMSGELRVRDAEDVVSQAV